MPPEHHPVADALFHRSSFCGPAACVEVALLPGDNIAVRDGKHAGPDSPLLMFDTQEWNAFLRGVEAGEFSRAALERRNRAGQA